ncbi:MAG: RNase adapter RapZ [Coriobacteriaceae bacterium]|nr:RNase adapter RapZ [Coriobacteriaceae bacterium]
MPTQESLEELEEVPGGPDLIIITGMSGAGRTEAMHTFEDLGYFCIDNLPPSLLMNLVSLAGLNSGTLRKLAVVCDLRAKEFFGELSTELGKVREIGLSYSMIFLDASDEALLNRFKASRRRHPLCVGGMTIIAGIRKERELLAEAKEMANYVFDTSSVRPQEMRKKLRERFSGQSPQEGMGVSVSSFGFKHGAPVDADIVIDVRFLPNPFYEPTLRNKTGLDPEVREYVLDKVGTRMFLNCWFELLDCIMPGYVEEGKQYLSIAIGCTGGQHRSVALAEATAEHLVEEGYSTEVTHRDLALAEVGS